MNKTILKNFAIDARNKLIQEITNKASLIGITEDKIHDPLPESTQDMLIFDIGAVEPYKIYNKEAKQYKKLIDELKTRANNEDYKTAYNTLIEEVAYTWFNRLIAIRFMEVNNYLPDKMRVLSSGREGVNEPEFVTYYQETSLDFTDEEQENLMNWKLEGSATSMDKMFRLLFIKQSNSLNENLPELFEKTDDYAELLLTISYNDKEGVLYKLVHDIPEQYFDIESEIKESEDDDPDDEKSKEEIGQVEIIGWLYQFYNTERKEEVFSRPKSAKIKKEDVPAVTQLFTPDWIVRYMVENSLGRLWVEKLIASGDTRTEKEIVKEFKWKYYIPETEQNSEATKQLIEIRKDRKNLELEDIKFMDPAMGSFHIGVYAFEVFMQLYESQGYTSRVAAKSIIENNLFGLEIDKRAYQLSYFALMMKGRQYNRKILSNKANCNLFEIVESNNIDRKHLDFLGNNIADKKTWENTKQDILEILDIFKDVKEHGSILKLQREYDFNSLRESINNIKPQSQISVETFGIERTQENILKIIDIAEALSIKYDIVSTNPPYLGSSGMNPKLNKYVKDNYPDSKSDLFAVFMERCRSFSKKNGFYAMITQHAWMFLSSYEKLRNQIQTNNIINMLHLGTRAFEEIGGEVVQTTSFVVKNATAKDYKGCYVRLVDFDNAHEKENKTLEAINNPDCGYYYETEQGNFEKIPGMPISYWASQRIIEIFEQSEKLESIAQPKGGLSSTNNDKFLRLWNEVKHNNINFNCSNEAETFCEKYKWFPFNKGGGFRKWYGNRWFVVNWQNNGEEIKIATQGASGGRIVNSEYYFKESVSCSAITSKQNSFRFYPQGAIFDINFRSLFFSGGSKFYHLGLLNSSVINHLGSIISATIALNGNDINRFPILDFKSNNSRIEKLVENNVSISNIDWDTFETSWDFKVSPLVNYKKYMENYYHSLQEIGVIAEKEAIYVTNLEHAYEQYKEFTNLQFEQLKTNEEELNRIFIEIYGLEDELTPEVSDKDITITKIFDSKDEIYDDIKGNKYILTKQDVIKSFISYAVGCMFGRYSLDVDGLAFAGGKWDNSKYSSFIPTKDNVLLITDEEYFEDDIVNRFIEFVKVAYGEEILDENLEFIADALGGKGTPKEIIRNYFIKDFFKDHCKTYSVTGSGKRPIYWQYDSGKQNGFKALIYMHRYDEDTTGKVRIDYLHKMQKSYERTADNLQYEIDNNKNPREAAKAEKKLTKIMKQLKETKDYDEKIAHLALERISIDLDDGVKVNYDKIQTDEKGNNLNILAKI